jgi:hypothetical protein
MIVGGLVGEAATIVFVPPGSIEKSLSVAFTLIIAAGVWIEEVGAEASDAISEREIAELSVRAAEATDRALATQLALEKFKAPRTLTREQQAIIADRLKEYSGMQFIVEAIGENEPQQTAQQIGYALASAGWSKFNGEIEPPFFEEGVVIEFDVPTRGSKVAKTVANEISAAGIVARSGRPLRGLGPNAIRVLVGPKPNSPDVPRPGNRLIW